MYKVSSMLWVRSLQGIAACLTALLVWQLVLWWLPQSKLGYSLSSPVQAVSSLPNKSLSTMASQSFQIIQSSRPKPAVKKEAKLVRVIPIADMNIKLLGLIVSPQNNSSRAILSVENRAARIYKINDSLRDNVTLEDILPTALIVNNHGETVQLALPKGSILNNVTKGSSNNKIVNTAPASPRPKSSEPNTIYLESNLRQSLMQNPLQATKYVRAAPKYNNGTLQGYTLRKGSNVRFFDAGGFKENDIITHINGQHVKDITANQLMTNGILNSSIIPVTIIRNGNPIDVEIRVQ